MARLKRLSKSFWVLAVLSRDMSPDRRTLVEIGSMFSTNFWSMSFSLSFSFQESLCVSYKRGAVE